MQKHCGLFWYRTKQIPNGHFLVEMMLRDASWRLDANVGWRRTVFFF